MVDIVQSWGDQWEEGQSGPGDPSPHTKDKWASSYLEQAQEVVYPYTCMCNMLRLYRKVLEGVGSEREPAPAVTAGPELGKRRCLSLHTGVLPGQPCEQSGCMPRSACARAGGLYISGQPWFMPCSPGAQETKATLDLRCPF